MQFPISPGALKPSPKRAAFTAPLGLPLKASRLFLTLGGDEEARTPGLLLARQALSHLSYTPAILFALSSLGGLGRG